MGLRPGFAGKIARPWRIQKRKDTLGVVGKGHVNLPISGGTYFLGTKRVGRPGELNLEKGTFAAGCSSVEKRDRRDTRIGKRRGWGKFGGICTHT